MKLSYVHAPRQVVEAELTKVNSLKSTQTQIFSEDGKVIAEHQPKRRYEFDGALYRYYSDIAKYLCTHRKTMLKGTINRYEIRIKWETFVKMAIGDHHDQYHRFMSEMRRNVAEPKYCYLPKRDGGCFLMLPFLLDFESEDRASMSDSDKKQLMQLSMKDGVERKRIGYVTFAFAKPLFEQYLAGGQYYQHPPAFYATAYHEFTELNKCRGNCVSDGVEETAASVRELDAAVDTFITFIDYLYLHAAGTHSCLTIDMIDMARHVMPGILTEVHNKTYIRDRNKVDQLLESFVAVGGKIQGLDFTIEGMEAGTGTDELRFHLKRQQRKPDRAHSH